MAVQNDNLELADATKTMVTIRRLLSRDAALACRVVIGVKPHEERHGNEPNAEFMSQFLSAETNYLFAALQDDIPVAYALAYRLPRFDRSKNMFYLHDIAVLADWRRRGIGRQLMSSVLETCRSEEFSRLFLITDRSNVPACGLYAGTGGTASADQVLFFYDFDESQ